MNLLIHRLVADAGSGISEQTENTVIGRISRSSNISRNRDFSFTAENGLQLLDIIGMK